MSRKRTHILDQGASDRMMQRPSDAEQGNVEIGLVLNGDSDGVFLSIHHILITELV